jgi:hypothetical protein
MKLFVWEGDGVLTGYSNGMIVAVAEDLESALNAVAAKCGHCMSSFPNHKPSQIIDLNAGTRPTEAWVCWGGG